MSTHHSLAQTTAPHPLDMLKQEEIRAAKDIALKAGIADTTSRFPYLALEEPPKAEVLSFELDPRQPIDRRVRMLVMDPATGSLRDAVISLASSDVLTDSAIETTVSGHAPIMDYEFDLVQEILDRDPAWRAALARRGIGSDVRVRVVPLSAGSYGIDGESGKRIVRAFGFRQDHQTDHYWAHPIDGMVAYVDLIEQTAVEIVEDAVYPVPETSGNYNSPELTGMPRTDIAPIVIEQPEGSSISIDGNHVAWQGWSLRVGFDPREGLTLHQIGFAEYGDRVLRPVVYRASVPEMVVPYADPSPVRFWQNYFDTGEYLIGSLANSLSLGCDCLGHIHYMDAVIADSAGDPRVIPNAICIHEEDVGILSKHTDIHTGIAETRRSRRLVISYFSTVGNYDYGFYWHLYQDGTIELEVKLTGFLFTSAYRREHPYASEVAPGLGAPYHQHLFNVRLDMMVDGLENAVNELEASTVPIGPENPYGNAFTQRSIRLKTETARDADGRVGRVWQILNTRATNYLGLPTSYILSSSASPTLLADPSSVIAARAEFARHTVWVTPYDPAERYPAGDLVNLHPGGAGLPEWQKAARPIDGADIVLWHTFGLTHFPRTEDWPMMPVDRASMTLRPHGFFDRNPTLNVPSSAAESHSVTGIRDHCSP